MSADDRTLFANLRREREQLAKSKMPAADRAALQKLVDPAIIDAWPGGAHSIFPHWMDLQARGRLHSVIMDGRWMHVGDPPARTAAERALAKGLR